MDQRTGLKANREDSTSHEKTLRERTNNDKTLKLMQAARGNK